MLGTKSRGPCTTWRAHCGVQVGFWLLLKPMLLHFLPMATSPPLEGNAADRRLETLAPWVCQAFEATWWVNNGGGLAVGGWSLCREGPKQMLTEATVFVVRRVAVPEALGPLTLSLWFLPYGVWAAACDCEETFVLKSMSLRGLDEKCRLRALHEVRLLKRPRPQAHCGFRCPLLIAVKL